MTPDPQLPPLSTSWGLALDLGDPNPDLPLQALYDAIWQAPEFTGPSITMGQYRGLARGAEGKLTLGAQTGGCYTKFEEDSLGYPPGWQVPLSFHLSLFGFSENLPHSLELYEFLLAQARRFEAIRPLRLALIGELTCYYLNADLFNEDWLDLHQASILALLLDRRHPFAQRHPGQPFGERLYLYEKAELRPFWTSDDEPTRYQRFKKRIAHELHSPKLGIEWERTYEN